MGVPYVVAALVFVLSCVGSYALGWKHRGKQAEAEIAAIHADLGEKLAKAQEKAAEVRERVVIQYRDRIQVIREVPPEVTHEIQVIRDSGCVVPAQWVRLHDAGAGVVPEAAAGADEPASCADAIEAIRANYTSARENAAQLEALQAWAAGISTP